jgi:hypothetical protein
VIVGEGAVPADADGLARLVIEPGSDVRAVVEMMSGVPPLEDRELRKRLRRRMHLVRMRASAMNRIFGLHGVCASRCSGCGRRAGWPCSSSRVCPPCGGARSSKRST